MIIPIAAMSASPTNGWRSALINFIHRLFAHRALGRQARNRELQSQERGKTSNAQRPAPNAQLSELEVGRWNLLRRFGTGNQQHGTTAMLEHALGRASHQQVIHGTVAMRAHHNQVGINGIGLL